MENSIVIDIGNVPQKKKILVVDDEAQLQSVIFDMLSNEYNVVAAYDGHEALKKVENFLPDLILMDIMMPDMGGYEAVRHLFQNEKTKNIPIVVMTAKNFDHSTVKMLEQEPNVTCFLAKPFKPMGLRKIIRDCIGST